MLRPPPREQPITDAVRRPGGLVEFPRRTAGITSMGQVSFKLGGMAETIPDHLIHVGQRNGGVLLNDFLRSGAFSKRCEYRIERNTRSSHSHDAIGVLHEGDGLCRHFRHAFRLALERPLRQQEPYSIIAIFAPPDCRFSGPMASA